MVGHWWVRNSAFKNMMTTISNRFIAIHSIFFWFIQNNFMFAWINIRPVIWKTRFPGSITLNTAFSTFSLILFDDFFVNTLNISAYMGWISRILPIYLEQIPLLVLIVRIVIKSHWLSTVSINFNSRGPFVLLKDIYRILFWW